MGLDVTYIISNFILLIVELVIFTFSLLIYKNTKGASLAYKKWAIATGTLLIAALIHIIGGLAFGLSEEGSSNLNEFQKLISGVITLLAYFYIPVGVMYLSKDMNFSDLNEKKIKNYKLMFFLIIFLINIFLGIFIPFFKIRKILGIIHAILYTFVWIFALNFFATLYKKMMDITGNNCWLYLYIAIWAGLFNNIFLLMQFLILSWFVLFVLLIRVVMAIAFIFGFLKLAKMLKVI